ncbi:ABC transporter substrate-binding protein [Oceanobacter mangrovi]|uniref:ABC transporter substrate-binding protein n=1 Tax=Oceanobacter mangrovi TaxID=2862510 RepID=UPI001C8D4A21|nr:ABC transporter substrate-binding protein [Oceanobacter mangrovi]
MKRPFRLKSLLLTGAFALISQATLAADKVTFQLDWLPGGDKASIYAGIDQGYFADEGIEVKISQGRGSTDAISKIATGSADVGFADLVALLVARANDQVPVKAVYSVFSEAPHAFFTVKGNGINSVSDVAGKKIATSPFTSSNIFLPLLLDLNKVDQDSISLVKADPGSLAPMLLTGNTDVVISWITDAEKYRSQAAKAGKELTVMPWYDAGLKFYATSVIASERFLQQRPDVARRFIRAYNRAVEFTWAHPQQAAEAVHKQVPEVDVDVAVATINSIRSLVYNDASASAGLGNFDHQRLADTWKSTAIAQKLDPASFDPETAISREPKLAAE